MLLFDPSTTEGRILQAAAEEFAEHGLAGARVERIARMASVNKAMLYYYFKSKENLYHEVFGSVFRRLIPALMSDHPPGMPLEERLETFVTREIAALRANPAIPRMVAREFAEGGKHIRAVFGGNSAIRDLGRKNLVEMLSSDKKSPDEMKEMMHTIANLIGMTILPIIARPMLQILSGASDSEYEEFLSNRSSHVVGTLLHGCINQTVSQFPSEDTDRKEPS